jgi:hypothetical protein
LSVNHPLAFAPDDLSLSGVKSNVNKSEAVFRRTKNPVLESTRMAETPEAVAFALLEKIWKEEEWGCQGHNHTKSLIDRKQILDTYAQCLAVVRGKKPTPIVGPG